MSNGHVQQCAPRGIWHACGSLIPRGHCFFFSSIILAIYSTSIMTKLPNKEGDLRKKKENQPNTQRKDHTNNVTWKSTWIYIYISCKLGWWSSKILLLTYTFPMSMRIMRSSFSLGWTLVCWSLQRSCACESCSWLCKPCLDILSYITCSFSFSWLTSLKFFWQLWELWTCFSCYMKLCDKVI